MQEVPNTMPGLFIAYSVIWLILAGYILSLGARLRKLEKRRDIHNADSS